MKAIIIGVAALGLSLSVAQAQEMNKSDNGNAKGPGTTGAMQNAPANGVATDPQQVQAQQGDSARASAGTVGAAPGGDTRSQNPQMSPGTK
jgi:hypothetical protein